MELALEMVDGEELLTEISCKYRQSQVSRMLADGGFALDRWFAGGDGLFGLALARRAAVATSG